MVLCLSAVEKIEIDFSLNDLFFQVQSVRLDFLLPPKHSILGFRFISLIWKRASRLRNSHLGTPRSQTEFVPIWGLTLYSSSNLVMKFGKSTHNLVVVLLK
jgi:hypothetical protein